MAGTSSNSDEINKVLLECEEKLRQLQAEGRLTADALTAFVDLTSKVRQEMARRSEHQDGSHPMTDHPATLAISRASQE